MDLPIKLELSSFSAQEPQIRAIRTQVFHQEQQIDPALDFDSLDEKATHIVAYRQNQPVGTARVRLFTTTAKIERVAVLLSQRNQGIGSAIMLEILAYLKQRATQNIILHAQCSSTSFYLQLGFVSHGSIFQEAGIDHIQMRYGYPNNA